MRIDAIFTNGSFITLDGRRPRASRIGVLHGRIVGLDEELDGVSTDRVFDLDGGFQLLGILMQNASFYVRLCT